MSYWLSRILRIIPRDAQTKQAIRAKFNHAPENNSAIVSDTDDAESCQERHLSEHTSLVTKVGQAASTATVTAGALLQKF